MNYKKNNDLLKPFLRDKIVSKPTKEIYNFYLRACNRKFSEKIIPVLAFFPGYQSLFLQILGLRMLLIGRQTNALSRRMSILHELGHANQEDNKTSSSRLVDTLKTNPTRKNLNRYLEVISWELDAWHWARTRAKDIGFLTERNRWRWNIIEETSLGTYRKISRRYVKKMDLVRDRHFMTRYQLVDPEWVSAMKERKSWDGLGDGIQFRGDKKVHV